MYWFEYINLGTVPKYSSDVLIFYFNFLLLLLLALCLNTLYIFLSLSTPGLSDLHRSRVLKQHSVLPQIHMISLLPGRGWGDSSPPHSELFLRSPAGSRSPRRSRYWGRSSGPCLQGHKTCTGEGSEWLFLMSFWISLHFGTLKRKFVMSSCDWQVFWCERLNFYCSFFCLSIKVLVSFLCNCWYSNFKEIYKCTNGGK